MWPASNPGVDTIIMWIECVVGSPRCSERFFPGTLVFFSPQKTNFNSSLTRNQVDQEPQSGCATFKSFIIYFIFINHYCCKNYRAKDECSLRASFPFEEYCEK